jgi:predicted AAA+ superfamily ATPase
MIKRNMLSYLQIWKNKPHRKPMILRGARQVGKSSLVRAFAQESFKNLAELNFEAHPEDADLILKTNSPAESIKLLSARLKTPIVAGETLLFLDEIQARPELIAALRYWHEEVPNLHIIAAGSLLEFALSTAEFSMPVGRVEYCFLGPLSFSEYLGGVGEEQLAILLENFHWGDSWPVSIHKQLLRHLKDYWIVGGMPEAVSTFATQKAYSPVEEIKRSIVATYQDDFRKYGLKINNELLRRVYQRAPTLVGQRAKFVEYSREAPAAQINKALDLLTQAKVLTRARHTSGNGIPFGAEAHNTLCKYIFVDIGLQLTLCDLGPLALEQVEDLNLINGGSLAEQFIGQHLLYAKAPYIEPELYYWERTKRNASAEIDYLITHDALIVPIEVKSGSTGRMQSLRVFLSEKRAPYAVRFSTTAPVRTQLQNSELISLPLYFVEQTVRLLSEIQKPGRKDG